MNTNSRLGETAGPARAGERRARRGIAGPRAWSKELLFVAALCRWPATKIDGTAMHDASPSIDWTAFLASVRRQRVEGLVHAGLKAAAVTAPEPVANALIRRSAMIARDSLAQAAESVRIAEMLRADGIEPLFLKGVTLAMLAYGKLGVKHSRDIDIIVPPKQAMAAIALLRREGYDFVEAGFRDQGRLAIAIRVLYELELRNPAKGTLVELHWRLFDFEHLLAPLFERRVARTVPVGSFGLPTFDDDDLFAYLCVHCARHGWARLKWLADINALISGRDAATVERMYAAALARGGGRAVAVTLLLCQELFGLELRTDFARRLRADPWARWLMALAQDILDNPVCLDDRPFAKIRLEAAQLLLGQDWRHARAVIGRQWAGTTERLAFPLPRGLFFIYGIIRPPLWLARRFWTLVSSMRPRKQD